MTMTSKQEFERSQKVIPGGVNSPVRAFKSVGGEPIFIKRAKGSIITDIEDKNYIDFVSSWGPLILGHAHDAILEAINKTAQDGTSFGAPTILESEMAELIVSMVPSIEKVRMVNSGTEATMSAIRLARGYTGKELIIKFAGCFHGHGDSFLIKAGSGAMTLGIPDSPGVIKGVAKSTLIAEYNDLASVEKLFTEHSNNIAAIIVEPIAGNMGVVLPQDGFLQGLRQICDKHNSLLIFDEVISGFRVSTGGAQELYNVMPDLTTLGKIIGGGLPVGAYGGKAEIMNMLAPLGPVYQAGTLSGNPLAMSAGKTMLTILNENRYIYTDLEAKAIRVKKAFEENLLKSGIKGVVNQVGSMLTLFFTSLPAVTTFDDAMSCDTNLYAKYFKLSLDAGMYIAPSQFECTFMSNAHTNLEIDEFIKANEKALMALGK